MQFVRALFATLAIGAQLGLAHPAQVESRDIAQSQLDDFKFWVQYAAAAYCPDNYVAKSGTKLTCSAGNCPSVEKDDPSIEFSFSNNTLTDTAGFIAVDHQHQAVVLSFRGSYSVRSWISDVTFPFVDPQLCDGCQAELGFWSSWTGVRDNITEAVQSLTKANDGYQLVVVGHSLGAAVATLAAADLRTKGYPDATLYAYASPRVANKKFADFITAQGRNYRFTHGRDPVPKLPLLGMGYVHVSPEFFIQAPNSGNVSVPAQNVTELQGTVNWHGNTGTGAILPSDVDYHHYYFETTDGCKGPGLPFRRSTQA